MAGKISLNTGIKVEEKKGGFQDLNDNCILQVGVQCTKFGNTVFGSVIIWYFSLNLWGKTLVIFGAKCWEKMWSYKSHNFVEKMINHGIR